MLDSLILEYYNLHCPVLTEKVSKKDREKPWITTMLKCLITTRHIYSRLSKNGIISDECYKEFRNHVTFQLKLAKKNYFHNLLQNAKNNMRKIWNILNGLIRPQTNSNNRNIDSLIINDHTINDNFGICNELNQHFSTVGSRISEEFGTINHNILSENQIQNS